MEPWTKNNGSVSDPRRASSITTTKGHQQISKILPDRWYQTANGEAKCIAVGNKVSTSRAINFHPRPGCNRPPE